MSIDGFRDGHQGGPLQPQPREWHLQEVTRVRLDRIEETVVRGLREELGKPGIITSFVDEYLTEIRG